MSSKFIHIPLDKQKTKVIGMTVMSFPLLRHIPRVHLKDREV